MEIKEALDQFINGKGKNKGRKPDERYASFDYCYNYFYTFYKEDKISELASKENMQMSCLQLGFYLASWGMMRNSFLLEKSFKKFRKLIKTISKMDSFLWEIDVDNYNSENIELILNCKETINHSLTNENKALTDTLITKIMLGVFANVPAFDTYFIKSSLGVRTFNENSLLKIKRILREKSTGF